MLTNVHVKKKQKREPNITRSRSSIRTRWTWNLTQTTVLLLNN